MKIFHGYQQLDQTLVKPILTIGNFDGVHLGHQAIMRLVTDRAKACGGTSVVYTFRPHPQIALNPDKNLSLLCTYDEKLELLEKLGIDVVIEEPFSRDFSVRAPERFFEEALIEKVRPIELIVGYDFGFGKGRTGGIETLRRLCEANQIRFEVVPAFEKNGKSISSSRIRELLSKGDLKSASELLGHPFSYQGLVLRGDGRGHNIGVPTANLHLIDNKMALPFGVYATWSHFAGKKFASVTNIGIRPTFESENDSVRIETHILDYAGDLYGRVFEVQFVEYLRPEQKFSGISALTEQISRDILKARQVLGIS